MFLLIPKRIKQLKAEGRREGRVEGRKEGRVEGRMEERKKARKRAGEARKLAGEAVDRFKKGEISIDELQRLLTGQDAAPTMTDSPSRRRAKRETPPSPSQAGFAPSRPPGVS